MGNSSDFPGYTLPENVLEMWGSSRMGSRNFKYANIQQISAVVAILIPGLVCPSMATVNITCSDLGKTKS